MKHLNYYLIGIPFIYSSYSLYKSASLADSFIIASFCALVGFFFFLERKYPNDNQERSELSKVEEELKLERAKLAVEQLKETNLREKALRDSRAAIFGQDNSNRQVKF